MYWPKFSHFPQICQSLVINCRINDVLKGTFKCLYLVLFEKGADMHGIVLYSFHIPNVYFPKCCNLCIWGSRIVFHCIAASLSSADPHPDLRTAARAAPGPAEPRGWTCCFPDSGAVHFLTSAIQVHVFGTAMRHAVSLLLLPSPSLKLGWPCYKIMLNDFMSWHSASGNFSQDFIEQSQTSHLPEDEGNNNPRTIRNLRK